MSERGLTAAEGGEVRPRPCERCTDLRSRESVRLWLDTLAVFACSLVFAALLAALVFLAEAASTPLGHPWSWEAVTA